MVTGQAVSGGHGERKSKRRTLAIAMLLQHPTVKAAAKAVGVAEQTLNRWLRDDPVFAREVEAARANVLSLASDELRAGTLEAVATLRQVLRNAKAPASAKVAAARVFLESTKLLEGLSVTVNNNVPQNSEEVMDAIRTQLSGMLRTDEALRETVKGILAEVERAETTIQ
jgi:hypothetical protein